MRTGQQNPTISLDTFDVKSSPDDEKLFLRIIRDHPFMELIPDADDLLSETRRNAEKAGAAEIYITTTVKREVFSDTQLDDGLVSVIVPTYNTQDFIVETLESIRSQDYKNIEMIIVDDGSEDETSTRVLDFMSRYSDSSSILFAKIPHMGNPGLPRNIAIYNFLSKDADYIAFMDGDDCYASTKSVSRLVSVLQKDPNLFAAYGDYDVISETGNKIARPGMLKKISENEFIWKKSCLLTWENIARSNLGTFHLQCIMLRKGTPFIPYRRRGEDEEFYARLFRLSAEKFDGKLSGIAQVPALIASYRKRSGSMSFRPLSASPSVDNSKSGVTHDDLPPFYKHAGIPGQYVTRKNISYWQSKRWLRLVLRSVFSGKLKGGLDYFLLACRDKQVRIPDLIWIALTQFFTDPAIKDRIKLLFNRPLSNKADSI